MSTPQQVTQFYWLKLTPLSRTLIAKEFSLHRSQGASVHNLNGGQMVIVSDGHSDKDLEVITVERMQELLKSKETDFWKLFDATVEKLNKVHDKELQLAAEKAKLENEKAAQGYGNPV